MLLQNWFDRMCVNINTLLARKRDAMLYLRRRLESRYSEIKVNHCGLGPENRQEDNRIILFCNRERKWKFGVT